MKDSKIQWTDHTFNPWIGCTKVSPGCAHCYAETLDKNRFSKTLGGGSLKNPVSHWGPGAPRHRTSEANWRQPLAWNNQILRQCRACGTRWHGDGYCTSCGKNECDIVRPRVFCASLADWLDDEVPTEWLADLLTLIHRTPDLDWLLLTKRPENFRSRLIAARGGMFADPLDVADRIDSWLDGNAWLNVWIGTTVEDQIRAYERVPRLLEIPANVRFLSCEPLLGPVDFRGMVLSENDPTFSYWPLTGEMIHDGMNEPVAYPNNQRIHWVICGGESGDDARPMNPDWARSLRDQCKTADVPFFFKQWGEWAPGYSDGAEFFTQEPDIAPTPRRVPIFEFPPDHCDRFQEMARLGKAQAGRLLDGVEHNEFPR